MHFWKLQASGNDFVLIDCRKAPRTKAFYASFAKKYCDRRFGIGADGILAAERSKKTGLKMRIFNADGSEAQMCGNGSRCFALWDRLQIKNFKLRIFENQFETIAGVIRARVAGVRNGCAIAAVRLSDPRDLRLDVPVELDGRTIRAHVVNTGVPHAVIFVEALDCIDVKAIGRAVRFNRQFAPAGTNVDFVEMTGPHALRIRTYERGVEDETLSCGTGTCAVSIVSAVVSGETKSPCTFQVTARSGEQLKVTFEHEDARVHDVWFEGKAFVVFEGEI